MDKEMKNAVAIMKQSAPKGKPVKRKTVCNGCRFAAWSKTASGKLHPSGYGRCTWQATYPVPASVGSYWVKHADRQMYVEGGSIERSTDTRSETYLSFCPVKETNND